MNTIPSISSIWPHQLVSNAYKFMGGVESIFPSQSKYINSARDILSRTDEGPK